MIVDPHIKATTNYSVFAAGIAEQDQGKNIFVQQPRTVANVSEGVFYGDCWPGNSSWIDFLNEDA